MNHYNYFYQIIYGCNHFDHQMQAYGFKIKVSDLLRTPGSRDTITFSEKTPSDLVGLLTPGVSGTISLQSLNTDEVLVLLQDIQATLEESCEKCGKIYQRAINIEEFTVRFKKDFKEPEKNEELLDDEFPINPKDELIDIEEPLIQAIKMEEPLIKLCETCSLELQDLPEEESDEVEYLESNEAIKFKSVKK